MSDRLTITAVFRGEDGGTGDRWIAMWRDDYDGSGPTIEAALADLARSLGEAMDDRVREPSDASLAGRHTRPLNPDEDE